MNQNLSFSEWQAFVKRGEEEQSSLKLVETIYISELNQEQYQIDRSLRETIKEKVLETRQVKLFETYYKYMAILLRELLRGIKEERFYEFEPYIGSACVESGFWRQPEKMEYEAAFSKRDSC